MLNSLQVPKTSAIDSVLFYTLGYFVIHRNAIFIESSKHIPVIPQINNFFGSDLHCSIFPVLLFRLPMSLFSKLEGLDCFKRPTLDLPIDR